MATKREWLLILSNIKKEPRLLSPSECDELILLLGGTVRPNHRPEVIVFGKNRRMANMTAIADIVFGFMSNAEELDRIEVELKNGNDPRLIAHDVGGWTPSTTTIEQANFYVARHIENLRPRAAKTRAEAERLAVQWFATRGVTLTQKQIQNELNAIREKAGLKRLGLVEWRNLE